MSSAAQRRGVTPEQRADIEIELDIADLKREREKQPAARIRTHPADKIPRRWLPLRFVLMAPLIVLMSVGYAAEIAFNWLDWRLQ